MNQSSFIRSTARLGAPMVLLLVVVAHDARSDQTKSQTQKNSTASRSCQGMNEIDMNACLGDRARDFLGTANTRARNKIFQFPNPGFRPCRFTDR